MSDGSEDEFDDEIAEEPEQKSDEDLPDNPLVQELIPECLSMLCKIGNGLAHAFVKMDCHDRELTDIEHMKNFIHVRYVDISGNLIQDISPLNNLTHLLTLKADKNNLTSAKLDPLPYLQIVELAQNKLTDTEGIDHPQLAKLNLNRNLITNVSGLKPGVLVNLHTLELRGNKLESTMGLQLPSLKKLYLAANQLTVIEGLDQLENLELLHLRDNLITSLDGFGENMKKLQYLNLRGNNIAEVKEVKKLVCLPLFRALVLNDNPCIEEDGYRTEVLIILRRLVRLDKEEYTDEDRVEAEDLYEQRRQEELLKEEQKEEEEEEEHD